MTDNHIKTKSKAFAIRIIKLYQHLIRSHSEFVISKQLLRSGTSIGANICEGLFAQSQADFIAKLSISLKEAAETRYWLELLCETEYLTKDEFDSVDKDCSELIALLTSILKTSRKGLK